MLKLPTFDRFVHSPREPGTRIKGTSTGSRCEISSASSPVHCGRGVGQDDIGTIGAHLAGERLRRSTTALAGAKPIGVEPVVFKNQDAKGLGDCGFGFSVPGPILLVDG
jgi:hypothetical protein